MQKNTDKDILIDSEKLDRVHSHVQGIETELHEHGVTLSPKERLCHPRTGAKRKEFTSLAYSFAEDNSMLLPGFVNMEDFTVNFRNAEELDKLLGRIQGLERMVKDMLLYARGRTAEPALECYAAAKRAANRHVPGAEVAARSMRDALRRSRTKTVKTEEGADDKR
jgi:hypothetical protein